MRIKNTAIFAVMILLLFFSIPLVSRDHDFQLVDMEKVSRYSEDRIAYQQIELAQEQFARMPNMDSSVASLLIIKDSKMYLFKDGYDNLEELAIKRRLMEIDDKIPGDLSANNIDGKPDYIRITERRIEMLKKIDAGEENTFVAKNFGKFYLNTRNAFLEKHIDIFRQLMINRKDSGLYVDRLRLPRRLVLGGRDEEFKFATRVTAKSDQGVLYYAEDANGDGVTETFFVHIGDGFDWGYKSGPNIIFIYNNTQEDIKAMIGNLTKEAWFGTAEEEEVIKANMDFQFRKSMRGRSVQGKDWDDKENIQQWLKDIIYESELTRKAAQ